MVDLELDFGFELDEYAESAYYYYDKLLTNRWWRLNNLYMIKVKEEVIVEGSGRKEEATKIIKFRPNENQRKFLENIHSRNIILKARQLGFTTLIQILMLDACLFNANTNAGVAAQTADDAKSFFKDKIKFAYDNLPEHVKILKPADTNRTNELSFKNGSLIRVGTSLRGGTYHWLHISEYGKICAKDPQRAREIRTGALNTVPKGGFVAIESTAEGRMGDFFDKCQRSRQRIELKDPYGQKDYKFHFFPWWGDVEYSLEEKPRLTSDYILYFEDLEKLDIHLTDGQKAWYIATAEEQGEDMKREYPSTPDEAFEAAIEGAYFARQMSQVRSKRQIINIPVDPSMPIHTFWDLGRDTTPIWFFQRIGFDYRFVDYYENSGEGMEFYINVLKEKKDGGEPYHYGDMYLPHDGKNKSLAANNKSPADILYSTGYNVYIVPRTSDKAMSIQRARSILPMCWFDKVRCEKGIRRLDGYRKEWDETLGTWKRQPLHDICSHGADAFMTFADGYVLDEDREEYFETRYLSEGGRSSHAGY